MVTSATPRRQAFPVVPKIPPVVAAFCWFCGSVRSSALLLVIVAPITSVGATLAGADWFSCGVCTLAASQQHDASFNGIARSAAVCWMPCPTRVTCAQIGGNSSASLWPWLKLNSRFHLSEPRQSLELRNRCRSPSVLLGIVGIKLRRCAASSLSTAQAPQSSVDRLRKLIFDAVPAGCWPSRRRWSGPEPSGRTLLLLGLSVVVCVQCPAPARPVSASRHSARARRLCQTSALGQHQQRHRPHRNSPTCRRPRRRRHLRARHRTGMRAIPFRALSPTWLLIHAPGHRAALGCAIPPVGPTG